MFDEYFSNLIDDDADFMPLMPVEEIDEKENETLKTSLPILPLRNTVLFPGVVIPITIGRDKSLKALKAALRGPKLDGPMAEELPILYNASEGRSQFDPLMPVDGGGCSGQSCETDAEESAQKAG